MIRDYAKRPEKKPPPRRWRKFIFWCLWIVIVVYLGILIGHHVPSHHANKSVLVDHTPSLKPADVKKVKTTTPVQTTSLATPTNTAAPVIAQPTTPPPPQFDFYTLLPNMKVTIPKDQTTLPASAKVPYRLQFTSTQDNQAAQQLVNELAAAGVSARIQSYTSNNQTWYRVISSPYPNQDAAFAAQNQLRTQNIDSLLVKAPS